MDRSTGDLMVSLSEALTASTRAIWTSTSTTPKLTGSYRLKPIQGSHRDDGNDNPLSRFLDGFKRDEQSSRPAMPALDRRWFEQLGEQQQASGQAAQSQANHDVERHWAELTRALNQLDAERQSAPAWSRNSHGADISGLAGWTQGGGHGARGGVDAVSLCGTGTQLKGFSGIKEGVGKLSW